ncbi:MAG: FkbM family methyltransferase [Hyphomonadaceae bacterium]
MDVLRRLIALGRGAHAWRRIRAGRPQPVYLGDHTVLLQTQHGFKLYVDSRDVSLAPHLIMDGIWEPAVTALLARRLRRSMRVVEVGANVGYHSLQMADLIGPSGYMVCFEANPRLAQLLAQSLEINGFRQRSIVCAYAAGAHGGHSELNVFQRHMGASSLVASEATASEYNDTIDRISVPATTLDMACTGWPHVDFLKIDAEGAEPHVLEGAREVIARSPQLEILLEFGPAFWPSLEAAREFLEKWTAEGFRILRLTASGEVEPATIESLLDPMKLEELLLTRAA